MAGEACGVDEAFDPVDRSKYRMLVGGVLVETGPARLDRCPLEDGKTRERAFDHRRHEIWIHAVVEARLLVRIGHPKKHPSGFSVRVEAGRELDRKREVLIEPGNRFGHEDMPSKRHVQT